MGVKAERPPKVPEKRERKLRAWPTSTTLASSEENNRTIGWPKVNSLVDQRSIHWLINQLIH